MNLTFSLLPALILGTGLSALVPDPSAERLNQTGEEMMNSMEIPTTTYNRTLPPVVLFGRPGSGERRSSGESENRAEKEILRLASASLEQSLDPDHFRFTLKPRWIPATLLRSSPDEIVSVVPLGEIDRYTRFEVTVGEGGLIRTTEVQIAVNMDRKLPVAGRRIVNGEVLKAVDFDLRWVPVGRERGEFVEEREKLEGKTIRRMLNAGQPVRRADVAARTIVKAGDAVTLIFENQGVRIELAGEARQNGAEDEEIRIYSSETRRRYLGRIIGPGEAIWKRTL